MPGLGTDGRQFGPCIWSKHLPSCMCSPKKPAVLRHVLAGRITDLSRDVRHRPWINQPIGTTSLKFVIQRKRLLVHLKPNIVIGTAGMSPLMDIFATVSLRRSVTPLTYVSANQGSATKVGRRAWARAHTRTGIALNLAN